MGRSSCTGRASLCPPGFRVSIVCTRTHTGDVHRLALTGQPRFWPLDPLSALRGQSDQEDGLRPCAERTSLYCTGCLCPVAASHSVPVVVLGQKLPLHTGLASSRTESHLCINPGLCAPVHTALRMCLSTTRFNAVSFTPKVYCQPVIKLSNTIPRPLRNLTMNGPIQGVPLSLWK